MSLPSYPSQRERSWQKTTKAQSTPPKANAQLFRLRVCVHAIECTGRRLVPVSLGSRSCAQHGSYVAKVTPATFAAGKSCSAYTCTGPQGVTSDFSFEFQSLGQR